MKVIDPGHKYELRILDGDWRFPETLTFVKREGPGYPGNNSSFSGTTTQEVLRALIDRTKYVNNQIPDWRNDGVLDCLREAIYLLEQRAAERHGRYDAFIETVMASAIEEYATCEKCNHIGCGGECH